jgi:SecD/SecF fusion protein
MKTNFSLSGIVLLLALTLNSCVNRTISIDGGKRLTLKFLNSNEKPENIEKALGILKNRVYDYGIKEAVFSYNRDSNRLIIELPLADNSSRINKLLCSGGKVEFWETYENSEIIVKLFNANADIAKNEKHERSKNVSGSTKTKEQLVLLDQLEQENLKDTNSTSPQNLARNYPLLSILRLSQRRDGSPLPGATVGFADYKDTTKINRYLNMKLVKDMLPKDVKFLWSRKPVKFDQTGRIYELFAIKKSGRDAEAPITGDVVVNAREEFDQSGSGAEINMSMNAEGTQLWARMTRENVGRSIAIVFDNYVYSAPRVNSEIPSGNSQITGNFTVDEAKDLANILKNKQLPVKVEIVNEEVIEGTNYSNIKIINNAFKLMRKFFYRRAL